LKASETKLQTLLRTSNEGPAGKDPTFARVADLFLDQSHQVNERETYLVHKLFLQSFKEHVEKRKVSRLCEADLDSWCRARTTWNENTCIRAKAIVLAALNFGVKTLNLASHPLR